MTRKLQPRVEHVAPVPRATLTIDEAVVYTNLNERVLRRAIAEGRLKHFREGVKTVILIRHLDEYLEQRVDATMAERTIREIHRL